MNKLAELLGMRNPYICGIPCLDAQRGPAHEIAIYDCALEDVFQKLEWYRDPERIGYYFFIPDQKPPPEARSIQYAAIEGK